MSDESEHSKSLRSGKKNVERVNIHKAVSSGRLINPITYSTLGTISQPWTRPLMLPFASQQHDVVDYSSILQSKMRKDRSLLEYIYYQKLERCLVLARCLLTN